MCQGAGVRKGSFSSEPRGSVCTGPGPTPDGIQSCSPWGPSEGEERMTALDRARGWGLGTQVQEYMKNQS